MGKVAQKGAYVLQIDVSKPIRLQSARYEGQCLPPGRYLYCGSAYGPGGLSARLRRHLSKEKSRRWHVDDVTLNGRVSGVGVVEGGSECELVVQAKCELDAQVVLRGFGSSDCLKCTAHLVRISREIDVFRIDGLVPWEMLQ